MSDMLCLVSIFSHSHESLESQHGDSGPAVLELWKEIDNLRNCVTEKVVHSLGLCRLGRRELV
jgi:hypothetical protein